MCRARRIFALAFVAQLVVAALVVGAPVHAQSTSTPSTPPTTSDAGNNSTGNATDDAPGVGGGGSVTVDGPGGVDAGAGGGAQVGKGDGGMFGGIWKKLANYIITQMRNLIEHLINTYTWWQIGVPAPGDPGDPSSWDEWDNGLWPAAQMLYYVLFGLSTFGFGMRAMGAMQADPKTRSEQLNTLAKCWLMSAMGIWLIPFANHMVGQINMVIAPDGADFLDHVTNWPKLGAGLAVFLALIALGEGAVIALAWFMSLMMFALFLLIAGFWPAWWLGVSAQNTFFRMGGLLGMGTYIGLLLISFVQACIMFFVFYIPWDAWSVGGPIGASIVTVLLLGVAWIGIPVVGVKAVIGTSSTAAALSTFNVQGKIDRGADIVDSKGVAPIRERVREGASSRYGSARDRVRSRWGRGETSGGRDGDSGPATTSSSSSSRSGATATDGGSTSGSAESDSGRFEDRQQNRERRRRNRQRTR